MQDLIDTICDNSQANDKIIWELRNKELRWRWFNCRTEQEWFLKLSEVKRMSWLQNTSDPCNAVYWAFLRGEKNPFEAKQVIGRLERLKAFW